jgi:hypothetical protein
MVPWSRTMMDTSDMRGHIGAPRRAGAPSPRRSARCPWRSSAPG